MSTEDFRAASRVLLERMLGESHTKGDAIPALLESYVDQLTRLHGEQAHLLLNEIIEDTRARLDARLSPDPVRQTIASVQTVAQDLWKSIWGP